jgi:alkylation response protein AidB-like acyl-CoA dehydrogenase
MSQETLKGVAHPGLSTEEALKRAAELTPVLRQRSAATNEARRVPEETMRDFHRSGLFRLLQPVRYGGVESDLETFVRTVIQLSRGCGSAGWVFSVVSIHQWMIGMYPDQAQNDVWGKDPSALAASSFHPGGKVSREAGGYRLAGTWSFCSGCDNVQWMIIAGFLGMTGTPPHPDIKMFLVPMSDCEIEDNWHVIGLRGTGSKNVKVKNAFVPEHRVLDFFESREARTPGRQANPGPLYRLHAWANFPICLASPAVGIAWGAYDRFVEYVKTRANIAGRKVAEFNTVQMRVAEAASMVDAAELLLRRDARESYEAALSGKGMDMALRARNRRDHGYAAVLACQATEKLLRACGAQGLFDDSEIQQCYRDVYATGSHIGTNWDMSGSIFGMATLGLPVTEAFY